MDEGAAEDNAETREEGMHLIGTASGAAWSEYRCIEDAPRGSDRSAKGRLTQCTVLRKETAPAHIGVHCETSALGTTNGCAVAAASSATCALP
ncbi:unnamed protein product [Toxocara canis]|uniref:Uncharacterized protein n=1 Tax=Toxocara canis TaxID=6265 RepID=A0A183UWZ5_TOXCA|nr:unnamed protein product [Toxocara canis]